MLMGAAHNALRAFNARVSLTLPVRCRPQAATLAMLRQSKSLEALERLYGLSKPQLEFLRNASEGHGIIKMGNSMIPFSNLEPKDTAVYKLITTKPGEATAEK